MFGMFGSKQVRDLSPTEVQRGLTDGTITLVDVREVGEFAAERIAGAINLPLSSFDPAQLPDPAGRTLVMQCGSGKRSATAVDRCQKAGLAFDAHLAGGIMAWKAAGLPTVSGPVRAEN